MTATKCAVIVSAGPSAELYDKADWPNSTVFAVNLATSFKNVAGYDYASGGDPVVFYNDAFLKYKPRRGYAVNSPNFHRTMKAKRDVYHRVDMHKEFLYLYDECDHGGWCGWNMFTDTATVHLCAKIGFKQIYCLGFDYAGSGYAHGTQGVGSPDRTPDRFSDNLSFFDDTVRYVGRKFDAKVVRVLP